MDVFLDIHVQISWKRLSFNSFVERSIVHQQDTMNEENKIIRYKYILNSTKTVVWGQMQRPFFDPRALYLVYKISSLYPVPSQMNPVRLQNPDQSVNAV
jgi:hypothetical protein